METWIPVPEFEDYYEISSLGNVRSFDRVCLKKDGRSELRKGRVLKPSLRAGYPFVNLSVNGTHKQVTVHRLVAASFCEKKDGCNVVNHLDGNKSNNAAYNLEWTTHQGNSQHAVDIGLLKPRRGESHSSSKLTCIAANEIRQRLINGEQAESIARDYGVKGMCISDVRLGKKWFDGSGIDVDLVEKCKSSKAYRNTGSSHAMAKIDEMIAIEIVRNLKAGCRLIDVANAFNVIPATVSSINRGKAWAECVTRQFGPPPYSPRSLIRKKRPY